MKLTEEQAEVVEKNHSLIYWYAKLTHLNLDEWYDLLAIELCYSVMQYDPAKGALSSFFKLKADGMVYKEWRKSQTQKRCHGETEYYDSVISGEDSLETSFFEHYGTITGSEDEKIIKLRYDGYTQQEIADMLNVSQSYISIALKRLKNEYRKINGQKDS